MSNPAALAAAVEVLKESSARMVDEGTNFFITATDKLCFDLDTTGRARETKMLEEKIRSACEFHGGNVNIAIWNMPLNEDRRLSDIIVSKFSPTGKEGGFRVVVFSCDGWIRNDGDRGSENWLCAGNNAEDGN